MSNGEATLHSPFAGPLEFKKQGRKHAECPGIRVSISSQILVDSGEHEGQSVGNALINIIGPWCITDSQDGARHRSARVIETGALNMHPIDA